MLNQKNSFTHCNSQMQKLLLNAEQPNQNLSRNIRKSIADDIQDMKDFGSVIVQKKNFAIVDGKIEEALQKYDDLMACEWECNEFYVVVKKAHMSGGVLCMLECLQEQLCTKFPLNVFCIMISLDDNGITAHCFQVRGEEFYFDTNLDNYDQPVLYAIVGTSFSPASPNDVVEDVI